MTSIFDRAKTGDPRSAYARSEQPSDETLAALAAAGERDAMELLLQRNAERIHLICRRITCHPEDAKDATQEAMIALFRNIAQFDGRSTFATWMYRVATNAALGEVRRRQRRPALLAESCRTSDVELNGHLRAFGSVDSNPASGELDQRVDIDAILSQLAPEFRAAVTLRDLYDLDYPTIGEVLGLPQGTVRSRIHRGRQAIRALLDDQRP